MHIEDAPFPTGSSLSDLPQHTLRTIPKLMFSLRYRNDPGLAFLQFCAHADLKDLADILMTEKGEKRLTEQLSAEPHFTGNKHDLTKAWHLVAAELQRFGGDTVVSIFRGGQGVIYWETRYTGPTAMI